MATVLLRHRLKELDVLIAEQKRYLDELKQEKSDLESTLLPDQTYCHGLSFRTLQTPLAVASVSRSWREIALSTAPLWSKIAFEITGRMDPDVTETYVRKWLERAASHPLSLEFTLGRDMADILDQEWTDDVFTPRCLRNLAHTYSDIIQCLVLDMRPYDIRQLELDSQLFPILRSAGFGSRGDRDLGPAEILL
ncbi:F-box domain-containing protein [Mycena venus]|uniref:F-box domain-containing protein n=1 Tax=Mycena venus TaxID=2733690 RepID=A0A8H7CVT1_9AGAR|nr:F-box domain-containing protein [Mycena venus]